MNWPRKHPVGALLPDHCIKEMIKSGCLGNISADDVNADSVDLRIGGDVAYELRGTPNLAGGFNPDYLLAKGDDYIFNQYSLADGSDITLSPGGGKVYMVELNTDLDLPDDVHMRVDGRSSSARLGLHVQGLASGTTEINNIAAGNKGKVYALLMSKKFALTMRRGSSIAQASIFRGPRWILSERDLWRLHLERGIVEGDPVISDNALVVHLDLLSSSPSNGVALNGGRMIDVDKKDFSLKPEQYFRTQQMETDECIQAVTDDFLLVGSLDAVRMPEYVSGHLAPYRIEHGDFLAHFAALFARGFGYGRKGEISGNAAVFEITVRSTSSIFLKHGQPIGKLSYEYLAYEPEMAYGEGTADSTLSFARQKHVLLPAHFQQSWGKVPIVGTTSD